MDLHTGWTTMTQNPPEIDWDKQIKLSVAAKHFKIPVSTLRRAAMNGTLETEMPDSEYLTTLRKVEKWIREGKHKPGPVPKQ